MNKHFKVLADRYDIPCCFQGRKLSVVCAGMAMLLAMPLSMAIAQKTPEEILKAPGVQAAMLAIKTNEPHFIDEQVRLCEISSPPFHEDKRAAEMARLFKEAGLANVRIDHAGNV